MSDILILGYAVLDEGYEEGKIMAVSGKDNTDSWDGDDINDPEDTGYALDQVHDQDPLLNPLVSGNNLQVLLAKITSAPPDQPSSTTYTVLQPSNMKMTDWSVPVAENVTLEYPQGTAVATNPHGLAQVNNIAYIGDYDSHKIFLLEAGELDGLKNTTKSLKNAPFDLDTITAFEFPLTAKGQSVIALQSKTGGADDGPVDYVFALFIVYDAEETAWNYSVLVRLIVNPADGSLTLDAYTTVGKNAQEMWPIFKGDTDADVLLAVPAIGGEQNGGTTNGTESNICGVPAFGPWPVPTDLNEMAAKVLVTGDPQEDPADPPAPRYAKDIRVAAASTRASTDALAFIMAAGFTGDYRGADFRIYRTTAGDLFGLYNSTKATPTISSLVGDELEVVREGQVYSSAEPEAPYGDYYLGLLYENADDPAGERLLQFLGSALTIDSAANFGGRSLTFGLGQGPGHIGGKNVNSAVQLAETIRQFESNLSLKRTVRATRPPSSVMVSGEDEEREDE
jgi:hypothetical protein